MTSRVANVLADDLAPGDVVAARVLSILQGFQEGDAADVIASLGALAHQLLRQLDAPQPHAGCVAALVELLAAAVGVRPTQVSEVLRSDEHLMTDFFALVMRIGVDRVGGYESAADVMEMMQCLADDAALKELCGERLIPRLLQSCVRDSASFRYQRSVASVLTNLCKQSKANKSRFGDCGEIVDALVQSSDFFFQMQCIELLYRAYRHNKSVLAGATALPSRLRAGIEALPNDRTLVGKMAALLDEWNAQAIDPSSGQRRIIGFKIDAARVGAAAARELCGPTSVYFSKTFLVLLLPDASGQNVTILYESIRQVRFSKDSTVTLRLTAFPEKLRALLLLQPSATDGDQPPRINEEAEAVVALKFAAADLTALKKTPIHAWMAEALEHRKLRASNAKRPRGDEAGESGGVDAGASHTAATTDQENAAASAPAKAVSSASSGSASGGPVERDANRATRSAKAEAPPPPDAAAATRFSFHTRPHVATAAVDDVLSHLTSVVQDRAQLRRKANADQLNALMMAMQNDIDDVRLQNRRDRDGFESGGRALIADLFEAEARMKERISAKVAELNRGLQEVQAMGIEIQDAISAIEAQMREAMSEAKRVEAEHLVQLKGRVDEEMRVMEAALSEIVSAANPMRFLTSYISRKLEEDLVRKA